MRRGPIRPCPAGLALLVLAACGEDVPSFGTPEPVTRSGGQIRDLWQGIFVAAMVVGAIVLGLILYAAVKFRHRNDDIPWQRAGSHLAEAIYVGIPVGIVTVLFAVSTMTEHNVTDPVAHPDLTVRVTGFQWGWKFAYPPGPGTPEVVVIGAGEVDPPVLVLPAGRVTRLELRSTDVIHSFWVPQFMEKRDVLPGVENDIDVTPTRLGVFEGRCAEYCGLDHWRMNFRARVLPGEEFDEWLTAQRPAP